MDSPADTATALYFQHIAAKAAAAGSRSVPDAVSTGVTTSTTAAAVAAVAAAASAAAAAAATTAAAAVTTASDTNSAATMLQSVPALVQTSSALLTQVEQLKQAAPLPLSGGTCGSAMYTTSGVCYYTNDHSNTNTNNTNDGGNAAVDASGGGKGNAPQADTTSCAGALSNAFMNKYSYLCANSAAAASAGGSDVSAQRAQAALFIERVRFLRSLPKSTSPVDARAYPSLLPPQASEMRGRKTLVLDVDETLVHSSYDATVPHDLHMRVDMAAGTSVDVYVAIRPYVRAFLDMIASRFEVVVFTASVGLYCNPLMDLLDPSHRLGHLRLCREHCSVVSSTYVKDLSLLGRDLDQVVIIDNSPVTYLFQQRNALPVTSWFDDRGDTELRRLMPVIEALAEADNVYEVLDNYNAVMQLQQQQQQQHM